MRSFHVLGTASQAPTKHRNHNGYLVDWQFHRAQNEQFMFDCGEGIQRQMAIYERSPADITRIFLTHFHGDHVLGLPGLIQGIVNATKDRDNDHFLHIYYPVSGEKFFNNLRYSCAYKTHKVKIVPVPISDDGQVFANESFSIFARHLKHRMPTLGYRIEENEKRSMDSAKLDAAGIRKQEIGQLCATGKLTKDGKTYSLDDFSDIKKGKSFAFVMDTVPCENAVLLAKDADLLVCESTYLSIDEADAAKNGHMTATQAAQIAVEANATRLVLTHFSQRYPRTQDFEDEAKKTFENSIAVRDGDLLEF